METMYDVCKRISALGFDVYMRDVSDSYAYFTDGKNIGYADLRPLNGVNLATVHVPTQSIGTGLALGSPDTLTRADFETALQFAPEWASVRDRRSVVKWPSLDAFLKANSWGGGLHKVDFTKEDSK